MFGRFAGVVCAVLAGPAAAQVGDYSLVPGDVVLLTAPGAETAAEFLVDLDGNIRVPGLGGVALAQETLDAAETRIEEAMTAAGLFLDPQVSLSIARYAPIFVSGDVAAPGRYDYVPGLTVSAALALAGGGEAAENEQDLSRPYAATRSRVQQFGLEIADLTVQLAGLEALLSGSDSIALTPAQEEAVPQSGRGALDAMIAAETLILEQKLAQSRELLRMWEQSLADLQAQRALAAQRLEMQTRLIAALEEEMATIQDLVAQGLQTSARLNDVLQQDAAVRARALEIENATIVLDRAISETEVERFSYISGQRSTVLTAIRAQEIALRKAQLDYERELEILALLAMEARIAPLDGVDLEIDLTVISPRRDGETPVTNATRLYPGDTLLVSISATAAPTQ